MKKDKSKPGIIFLGRYKESAEGGLTGPEKVAKRIFTGLTETGKTVFIEYFFDGERYDRIKKLFGREKVAGVNGSPVLRLGIISLLMFILKNRPRLIHIITNERFPAVIFFLKPFLKFKVIYNVHSIFLYEYENLKWKMPAALLRKEKKCEKDYIEQSDKLLFLDKKSLDIAKKYYSFKDSSVAFVRNGVDDIFIEAASEKEINYDGVLKAVFAGNAARGQKGFDFLVNSLNSFKGKLNLFIISDSEPSAINSGDNINISIVKKMNTIDYSKFLKDKDVFISPSFYDSFSITAAEAMASGLACILTKETGLSEYIKDGADGLIISYGDNVKLADNLEKLDRDRNLMAAVSRNGSIFCRELKWKNIFKEYEKIYKMFE